MSLINDVLRDLDKRQASLLDRGGLPDYVRPLPPASPRQPRGLVVVIGLFCLLIAFVLYRTQIVPTEGMTSIGAVANFDAGGNGDTSTGRTSAKVFAEAGPTQPPSTEQTVTPGELTVVSASGIRRVLPNTPLPMVTPATDVAANGNAPVKMATAAKDVVDTSNRRRLDATGSRPLAGGTLKLSGELSWDGLSVQPHIANQAVPLVGSAETGRNSVDEWMRAQSLLRDGQMDAAEQALRRVVAAQPNHALARQTLLGILLPARRYGEAVPILREGLVSHPDQTMWAMNLARLQVDTGDYSGAWEALSRGLPHAQNQPDYLAFAGTVLQRLNRSDEAAAQYQAALRLRPDQARWWVGLGIALEAAARSSEAHNAFLRAKTLGNYPEDMARFVEQKLQ